VPEPLPLGTALPMRAAAGESGTPVRSPYVVPPVLMRHAPPPPRHVGSATAAAEPVGQTSILPLPSSAQQTSTSVPAVVPKSNPAGLFG